MKKGGSHRLPQHELAIQLEIERVILSQLDMFILLDIPALDMQRAGGRVEVDLLHVDRQGGVHALG